MVAELQKEPLPFPPAEFDRRLERVRGALGARGPHALLVPAPANISYLSAFHTPAYDNFQFLLLPASGAPAMFNILHESECLVAARSYIEKRVSYPGWMPHLDAARDLLAKEGLAKARVGLDKSSFFFSVR